MKGLFISLVVFFLYVAFTILVSHFFRVKRHGRLFFPAVALWTPVYFILYFATPEDCGWIPETWLGNPRWLELIYGYIIYLLNCHSYIDFFFGFTGGFSMSLMCDLLLSGKKGRATAELITGFELENGGDKVYQRRIPHLAEAGMITVDGSQQICRATPKGKRWAAILSFIKRLLNLSKGG